MKTIPVEVDGRKSNAVRTREFRTRQAEAGRPRTDRFNADGSRHAERQFIAWDGEGQDDNYTLFAWSDGREFGKIADPDGLSTRVILEFIQSVATAHPQAIHIIFGGSYDFNHWLRDLDRDELLKIHTANKSGRNSFPTIEVDEDFPVQFSVLVQKWFYFKMPGEKKGVKVFDVLPFFQCSFVKACDQYLSGKYGEDTWLERDAIVETKKHRDDLSRYTAEQVEAYNRAELVNLVRLADTLRQNCMDVRLVPQSWHGPAAIASKMFTDNKVSAHMDHDVPLEVASAARYAYAGGRAEMLKYGDVRGPVYEYDVCSAYPAAMQFLPSLAGGSWQHHTGKDLNKIPPTNFVLYRIRWVVHPQHYENPGPFPMRNHDGSMMWPMNGEGWVWFPEYEVGVRSGYATVDVLEAWVFTPRVGSPRPFAFVTDRYAERQTLKRRGEGGQMAIKLGLNSMYGKLAQQTGARRSRGGVWTTPKYHQLEWAGWVTSWCRARVFEAATQNPTSIVSFATDAVFSTEPLSLDFGSGLGQWEETIWDEFCNIQAGFYFGVVDGRPAIKSRGVDRNPECATDCQTDHVHDYRTLPERIRDGWEEGKFSASKRGFVTLGLALAGRFHLWRKWLDQQKTVVIGSSRKRSFLDSFDERGFRRSTLAWTDPDGCSKLVTRDGVKTECGEFSHEFPIEWINPNPAMDRMRLLRETNTSAVNQEMEFNEREIRDE